MNKQQYLAAIRNGLGNLPQADINRSVEYYSEMIDDRIEEGDNEENAVNAMGSPENAVRQILLNTPLPRLVKAKAKPHRALRAWEIVLLILGAPVWLPLLIAVATVVISVYISFWAVIISLYAADLSIAVCAVSFIVGGIMTGINGDLSVAVFTIGAGVTALGLAPLMFFLFNKASAGLIHLGKLFVLGIKKLFIRKENN